VTSTETESNLLPETMTKSVILQPPFSAVRFAAETAVAYLWAELFNSAIPQEEVYGINFRHMLMLVPAVIALGKNQRARKLVIISDTSLVSLSDVLVAN